MRTRASTVRAIALILLLAGACRGADAAGGADAGPPVRGGTAVVGILSDFQAFNPVVNTSITTDEVIKQMLFTPLVQYDERLQVQPYLAARWELTDTAVTFHLRRDVRWHDGRPVTAEDVKFTFDLAKHPETASLLGSAYLNLVETATVLDPYTLRFRFVAPHAQALEGFWWAPVPRHRLQGVPPAELAQHPFNGEPVGSGPFRFASWKRGQQVVLERNPDFPAALGGPPYVERVVFRIIPEATTMVTELLAGGADVVGYTLLPDQARQLRRQRTAELRHFPSREFTYVGWNNRREPFRDARVRRALTLAIDRPTLIAGLLHGLGTPASGMIPPWSPLSPELPPLPYDPAAARRLLAEAGWRDDNADGILEKDGRPLRFTLLVNAANRMHQDIAAVMQQQLRELGVRLDLRTLEFQTLLRQHKARDYDAVLANWTLDTFKVDPTPLFTCAEARKPNSANRAGYCNPQADRLVERGLRTVDPAAARQTWRQFSELLQRDQPVTFLFWGDDLAGVGARLQGATMDVRSKLVSAPDWWIPEARQ